MKFSFWDKHTYTHTWICPSTAAFPQLKIQTDTAKLLFIKYQKNYRLGELTECTFDNLNNLNCHSLSQVLRNLFHNHSRNWTFFEGLDFSLQKTSYLLSKKSPLTYTENSTWLTFLLFCYPCFQQIPLLQFLEKL